MKGNILMFTITKNEYEYLKKHIKNPLITICSKHKHGSKGSRSSGKTYYCPESSKYLSVLEKYKNTEGVQI